MTLAPLNGTKTHPLTEHALSCLRTLARKPTPRQEINPGVVNRLLRGALAETAALPSPYKSHDGRLIEHLMITPVGRAAIKGQPK